MATEIISENTTGSYVGDYTGVDDASLKSSDPNAEQGGVVAVHLDSNATRHFVIQFPGLSNIPDTATVSAVTLGIYSNSSGTQQGIFRRCLRDWVELEVNWNDYKSSTSWTTAGGLSDGNDRSSTTTDTLSSSGSGWVTINGSQLVTDVQGFIDGTYSNYGWHVESQQVVFNSYVSSEGADGNRPYLEVTYTDSGGSSILPQLMQRF